jgi:lipopolysaccharide/colanic/teichoic acid biosynthesis glycosyltransferase
MEDEDRDPLGPDLRAIGARAPISLPAAHLSVVQNGTTPRDLVPDCSALIAAVRRSLDCLIAGTMLLALTPLLLPAAAAIWIDSRGKILFRQQRLGRHRRPFTLYKLRTIAREGDGGLHREYITRLIAGENQAQTNGDRKLFKLALEDHVTRVGRFLRRWSIDELPQLWNVLVGDMSLIGPRPVIPYEAAQYPLAWEPRFALKPGLTGLWQVSGRNQRTYHEMIELDLEYVRRRSLRLDAMIFARTIPTVLLRRGVS